MVDLDAIVDVIGDARVVGLGEALHAAAEYYELKDVIFRHLVQHAGFRFFVLESGFAEGLLVDAWITRRTELPLDDVLRRGFTYNMGCCEEFAAQLRWMRTWNDAHPDDLVRFAGTDLPAWLDSNQPALDVVASYLGRVSPDVMMPVDVDELVAWMTNREPVHARRSSREEAAIASRAAQVARSWRDYKHTLDTHGPTSPIVSSTRDQTMAETVLWLLQLYGTSARVAFGAHNGHLQRTPIWGGDNALTAGAYLAHHLGDDYVPIGTTFGAADGFGDSGDDVDPSLGISAHGYGSAAPDTIDHLLSARGDGTIVDLRVEPLQAGRMRVQGFAIPIDAPVAFDALVHLERVSLFHARALDRPDG